MEPSPAARSRPSPEPPPSAARVANGAGDDPSPAVAAVSAPLSIWLCSLHPAQAATRRHLQPPARRWKASKGRHRRGHAQTTRHPQRNAAGQTDMARRLTQPSKRLTAKTVARNDEEKTAKAQRRITTETRSARSRGFLRAPELGEGARHKPSSVISLPPW